VKCALCKTESPLKNSHIISEFFYKNLYDKIHRFNVITSDPLISEDFKQKGVYEKLLCGDCEQRFSEWEKYAKESFGDGVGVKIERKGKLFRFSNLDYVKFRLFLLSLLWRMGASRLNFFSLVELGDKHSEILRLALLKADPLEPLQYPCLISAVSLKGEFHRSWISQPIHTKSDGKHCHCIVVNGLLFSFFVTSHPLPSVFSEVCINKKTKCRFLLVWKFGKFLFWLNMFMNWAELFTNENTYHPKLDSLCRVSFNSLNRN
jgi:hypothetical protein